MRAKIELTFQQKEIMSEFYSVPAMQVLFNKKERDELWNELKQRAIPEDKLFYIRNVCPALHHQIVRHYESGNNIQSAVFSECAYAQTLAKVFGLIKFYNCFNDYSFIPRQVVDLLKSYSLVPRYAYVTEDLSRMLIQAGGCGGVDSALITVINLKIFTIEFKESWAKTSEPDLPKYGEDGNLLVTEDFVQRYPQFIAMLDEQKDLNFFEVMGSNVNNFSFESINAAITGNYLTKKFADVVCTEDKDGFLVMLPVNQISSWARIEGEIRPAGRNHYDVWTPNALSRFLFELNAQIENGVVTVAKSALGIRKGRGSNEITGYKINSLFYVYTRDCVEHGTVVTFPLSKVQQLNPTVAGKMDFKKLRYEAVRAWYFM